MTLLDYPGRLAATIFTEGCNFSCPFCHNASLVREASSGEYLMEEQVLSHLQSRTGKLSGLCISGGEPLVQKDLPAFIRKVKELGYAVKLDTNGSFPLILQELIQEKLLDYVAMDIKNCKEKYAITSGIKQGRDGEMLLKNIEASIDILRSSQLPFEFRTTLVKEFHSVGDIEQIGLWLSGSHAFFLQAFVDSGDTIMAGLSAYTSDEMAEMCSVLKPYIPNAALRGV